MVLIILEKLFFLEEIIRKENYYVYNSLSITKGYKFGQKSRRKIGDS